MADICRTCLRSSDMLVDIFAERQEDEPSLAVMLSECDGCVVNRDDALPKQLCLDCVLATQNAFKLKRSLQKLDRDVDIKAAVEHWILETSDIEVGPVKIEPETETPKDEERTDAVNKELDNQENLTPTSDDAITTKTHRYPTRKHKLKRYDSEDHCFRESRRSSEEPYLSEQRSTSCSSSATEELPLQRNVKNKKKPQKRVQAIERPCKCPYPRCTADFSSNKGLNAHIRRHGKRTYTCDSCPKAFVRKYDLDEHARVHTGERPFKCPHCSQSFTWNNVLRLHIRTHTGERPFKCTSCPKTFASSHALSEHSRAHANDCAFRCSRCSRSFKYKKTLRRHLQGYTCEGEN